MPQQRSEQDRLGGPDPATARHRGNSRARLAVVGVLGLATGTLVRHSAAAVTVVVAVMLLPSPFGPLFGDPQRRIAGATPTAALEKLTQTSDASHEVVGSLGAWPSLGLVAAYCVALLVVAVWRLRPRDV